MPFQRCFRNHKIITYSFNYIILAQRQQSQLNVVTVIHKRSKWIGPQNLRSSSVVNRSALDAFSSKPYYIQKDTLDFLFYEASSALYGQKDTKALVLSSFHPGASQMCSSLASSLADAMNARYVELDYFRILSKTSHPRTSGETSAPINLSPPTTTTTIADPRNIVTPFQLSSVFQSYRYQLPAKVDSPVLEREQTTQDASDREEFERSGDFEAMTSIPVVLPKMLSLNDVFIKMVKTGGKDHSDGSDHHPDSYRLHIRMGDDGTQSFKHDLELPHSTHISHRRTTYDIPHDDFRLNKLLYPFMQDTKQPFVLHIREIADILESNRKLGKSLVLRLLNEIEQHKTKTKQQILVVFSSHPPLTNSLNLQKPASFYSSLTKGSVQEIKTGNIVNLAHNLEMYDTHFDKAIDKFTKICIRHGALPTGMNVNSQSDLGIPDALWDTLKSDMNLRVMQLNMAALKLECQRRDLGTFPAIRQQDLITQRRSWPLVCSHVWSTFLIRRIANLIVGFDLEQNPSREDKSLESSSVLKALDLVSRLDNELFSRVTSTQVNVSSSLKKSSKTAPFTSGQSTKSDEQPTQEISENIHTFIRQKGIQLNSYEKKLIKTVVNPSQINTGFSDVILPPPTKSILQTLVTLPILRPDLFSTGILSNYSINGLLLFGPPGTGKTMLAKAAAKSCGARFMGVSLSDIFDKYVGEGEKNVRAIFSLARKLSPCIVFLDEVDAIFGARMSEGTYASRRELINEFMLEWDGVTSNNRGLIIVGATNRPFDLDDAILRRMPRRVLIDLPDDTAREKIILSHLGNEEIDASVSLAQLAENTKFYSGSDLKNLLVSASLARAKEIFVASHIPSLQGTSQPLNESQLQQHFIDLTSNITTIQQVNSQAKQQDQLETQSNDTEDTGLDSHKPTIGPLCQRHFDIALKEVPPSLSQEASSLVELRKWNEKFGEHGARSKQNTMWGFA